MSLIPDFQQAAARAQWLQIIRYEMNREEILKAFNGVLSKYGINMKLAIDDLTITEKVITDSPTGNPMLSNALNDIIWPSIGDQEVFHYTNRSAAKSIVTSKILRLYWLIKRFTEDEIVCFCKDHHLDGYLYEQTKGDPRYKSLIMKNLFYASFAEVNISHREDDNLWNSFGQGDGARLRFRIQATNPDFRRIVYSSIPPKPIPILNELSQIARAAKRDFLLQGISRLCAFYLPTKYFTENEYRIIIKDFQNDRLNVKKDGKHSYIDLPFNEPNKTGFYLTLLDIQTEDGTLGATTSVPISRRPQSGSIT
jgi:hypothetical protein